MLIKDACKECRLTKKAVEYYEKQDMINPIVGDNGYRNYNVEDIAKLKEISLLRKLGINIADIKVILGSKNKAAALSRCKYLMELELEKTLAQHKYIEKLISNYDIDNEIADIEVYMDNFITIKERLVRAFPGTYGMYLCIHFGHFLDEKIDTEEKKNAFEEIVRFLDNLDNIKISKELEEYIQNNFPLIEKADMEKMSTDMVQAINNIEEYLDNNKESLDEYLKFRTSEEYKETAAYKMQQLLLDFQKSSGYYDVFIPNLKILSRSYCEYSERLKDANDIFCEKFPEANDIK